MDRLLATPDTNVHKQLIDIDAVRELMHPLLTLSFDSKEALTIRGRGESLRGGRFKRNVSVAFEVDALRGLRIPA